MSSRGSITLGELQGKLMMLDVACHRCERKGRVSLARLIEEHGADTGLQNRWHREYGKRFPSWQCAGCGQLIGGVPALSMIDGNRVHLDGIDCLIRYGQHWRRDATRALVAIGLQPPAGEGAE